MINHPNRNRKFYAAQSPRGFANEVRVHIFRSRERRDAWVSYHEDDGDVNSASRGARKITAAKAREILGYRGDAATESYNGAVDHGDCDYGIDYVLVSDHGVAVPTGFAHVCSCQAGHYYGRPGVTREMIRVSVTAGEI